MKTHCQCTPLPPRSLPRSDAYDDRIFALSALLSSVLVYNLPETVRESDVEKLSFAVQLARGFYADSQVCKIFPCHCCLRRFGVRTIEKWREQRS